MNAYEPNSLKPIQKSMILYCFNNTSLAALTLKQLVALTLNQQSNYMLLITFKSLPETRSPGNWAKPLISINNIILEYSTKLWLYKMVCCIITSSSNTVFNYMG